MEVKGRMWCISDHSFGGAQKGFLDVPLKFVMCDLGFNSKWDRATFKRW